MAFTASAALVSIPLWIALLFVDNLPLRHDGTDRSPLGNLTVD